MPADEKASPATTLKYTLLTLAGVLGITIGSWALVRVVGTLTPAPFQATSHGELLSTLLTGLTISIAALALVIAIIAIVGYSAIRKEAEEIARKTARAASVRYLKSKEVEERIRKEVQRIIAEEMENAEVGLEMPGAFSSDIASGATMGQTPAPPKPLGKRRPRRQEGPETQ